MADFAHVYSLILSIGVLFCLAGVLTVTGMRMRKGLSSDQGIGGFLNKYGLWTAFGVALISTAGSLIYSEGIGFAVCILCWYQRIFMYPLVLLLGIAAYRNDRGIALYGMALAAVGGLIALYHYLLQMLEMHGVATLPCSAVGLTPSCAMLYVLEFGFVTIPFMALAGFLLLLLILNWIHKNPPSPRT